MKWNILFLQVTKNHIIFNFFEDFATNGWKLLEDSAVSDKPQDGKKVKGYTGHQN